MAKTLAEQLLSTGLVDEKKAQKAQKEKRQDKKRKGKRGEPDEAKLRVQRQRAEQVERDRQLNLKRQEAEQAKAIRAQVRQMLQQNKQKLDGDIRFNFKDSRSNRIKYLYVSGVIQDRLARGQLAICVDDDQYVVVPRAVADKVRERSPESLVFVADMTADMPDEDDPYKDYQVPDDLMW